MVQEPRDAQGSRGPTVNVTQIFALLPASNPFEPTLSTAPTTWQLPITSSTATQLAFTVGPSNTAAGSPISSITVTIEDASNNPQTSATNAVTLAIGANPSNGTLSGTTTVNAVNGVATFSGLNINKAGTGYLLPLIVAHSRIPCRRAPSPGSTSSHFPSNSDTAVRAVTKVTAGAIATG
jgi:hypothetical protein